jgi:AraC-like DNA-binding protein
MNYLFEQSNILNSPFEAFLFDSKHEVFPVKSHWHYFMEIIYMMEGTVIVNSDKEDYVLETGDLILFHPQAIHSIYAVSPVPVKYAVLKFDINNLYRNNNFTPKLGTIFKSAQGNSYAPIFFSAKAFFSFPLQILFNNCIEEIENKDFGYNIRFQSLVSSLLIEILRLWRKNGFNTDKAAMVPSYEEPMNTILEYIDEHSHESIKVEHLAEKCHMSYSYFAKKFHELYGQSCKEYIEFIRISKVKDLLLFTDFDINYISQETGFADCSHLIRTFKKKLDVTPKQFRLRHLK